MGGSGSRAGRSAYAAGLVGLVLLPASCRPPPPVTVPHGRLAAVLTLLADGGLAVIADSASPVQLEWWTPGSGPAEPLPSRALATRVHGLWVARLPARRRIVYRLRSHGEVSAAVEILARRRPGQPFRVVLLGNTAAARRRLLEAAAREGPDLVLHTGGLSEPAGDAQAWRALLRLEPHLFAAHPFVLAPAPSDRDLLGLLRSLDGGGCAFRWAHLLLVVDPGDGEDCARRALSAPQPRGQLRVLVAHEPPFSSGPIGWSARARPALAKLAARHGVRLVIAGADRHYERLVLDGVTYLVSGAAGLAAGPIHARPGSAAIRLEPHYVVLDVEASHIGVRALNAEGVTFDWAVIAPAAASF